MNRRFAFAVMAIYVLGMMFSSTAAVAGGGGGAKKTTLFKVRNSGTSGDLAALVWNDSSPPAVLSSTSATVQDYQKAGGVYLTPGAQASYKVAPQPVTVGAVPLTSGTVSGTATAVWKGTPVRGTNYCSIYSTGSTVGFDNGRTPF